MLVELDTEGTDPHSGLIVGIGQSRREALDDAAAHGDIGSTSDDGRALLALYRCSRDVYHGVLTGELAGTYIVTAGVDGGAQHSTDTLVSHRFAGGLCVEIRNGYRVITQAEYV